MPDVTVNEVRLSYQQRGDGDDFVWVSGTGVGGGIWDWWQIPHFAGRFRCTTFDLRGAGASEAPPGPYEVSDFAADTIALCEHLGIERAHFAGISLGSAIIQEIALARPELVRSASLISTWSSTAREEHIGRWFRARMQALQQGPIEVFRSFSFWMSSPTIIDLEPELQRRVEAFFAANSGSQPLHAYIAHFQADLGHETRDRLGAIRCPTLVVYGDEDLITLPRYNQTVAELVAGARLVAIPGAGHLAWVERGGEVNAAIDDFLASLEDSP